MRVARWLATLGFVARGSIAGAGLALCLFGLFNFVDPSILRGVSLEKGAWIGGSLGVFLSIFTHVRMRKQ